MAGHKVGNKVLFFPYFFIYIIELFTEFFVLLHTRLTHITKYIIADMLGSNFKLTAYVMLAQFIEKCVILIRNQIVIPDAASDKYLLHFRKCSEFPEKLYIILMTYICIRADRRIQTLLVAAGTAFKLLLTRRCTEVRRRTANIVDVSFEIFVPYKLLCFCQNGRLAS